MQLREQIFIFRWKILILICFKSWHSTKIQSKVLAFAFGLSAEIERNLISQRTKEALARKKAEGVVLGRPKGRKSSKVKLSGKEDIIRELRAQKVSIKEISRIYKVNRNTVSKFIKEKIYNLESDIKS